jgi:nucleoside 2-deoxyribosyltransferase
LSGSAPPEIKQLSIVGGVYHESCIWPIWDQVYGSGGRAAASVVAHVDLVKLTTYARPETAERFRPYADGYGFGFEPITCEQSVSFNYFHNLSVPTIYPNPSRIRQNTPITLSEHTVLRFGMMEGTAIIQADRCVYDPQSAFTPEPFEKNGSRAEHLAVVANRGEIAALSGVLDPIGGAQALLLKGTEVVVVKAGAQGAFVVEPSGVTHITAFQTDRVWTIGSGDVFAAVFAAQWAVHEMEASRAAAIASYAVAAYVESMALPVPTPTTLLSSARKVATASRHRVYIASPFFSLGQRWVVDEARRCLGELGLNVFSPVHDIGPGPAKDVAPSDLKALDECDIVFAILDGNDPGTLFELGYAKAPKARGIPVYALAQSVSEEDLKMVVGSGCRVYDDFVTALHHAAWRT